MRILLTLLLVASTAAAAPVQGRLAVIIGPSTPAVARPMYVRWANDAAYRFATTFSLTGVPTPADSALETQSPATCASLNVVGFLQPFRRTVFSQTTISITAGFTIYDCDGNRFYDGRATQTEARNQGMIPQAQINAIAGRATAKALQNFATFKSGHQVIWSRLIATGSVRDVAPTAQPAVSPRLGSST
jgi:hypothetical protein